MTQGDFERVIRDFRFFIGPAQRDPGGSRGVALGWYELTRSTVPNALWYAADT